LSAGKVDTLCRKASRQWSESSGENVVVMPRRMRRRHIVHRSSGELAAACWIAIRTLTKRCNLTAVSTTIDSTETTVAVNEMQDSYSFIYLFIRIFAQQITSEHHFVKTYSKKLDNQDNKLLLLVATIEKYMQSNYICSTYIL